MFKFEFNIPESVKKINLTDSIFLMGSCFSDEIGSHFAENKFECLSNPYGTIYNPYSIFKLLADQVPSENTIESQGVFYHWDAHGTISGLTKEEVVTAFDQKRKQTQAFLATTNRLIITLGTAYIYVLKDGSIVANCHKVPASYFKKRLISQEEIVEQFAQIHSCLSKTNPNLNILFTVSPVRHIRNGLIDNNRSKAILIDAIHSMVSKYDNVNYFPSYEILIDELRDYRFYQSDMVHPSPEAIGYVWKKFVASFFDEASKNFLEEWGRLKVAINHKPFQAKSALHQKFLKSTLGKLEKMNEKVDMSVEIEQLKNKIL